MSRRFSPTFIAAVNRAEYLALAVFRERTLLELRQHRLSVRQRTSHHLGQLISELALDYGAERLVIEPDSFLASAMLTIALRVERCALRRGDRWLLGTTTVSSERDLCRQLVESYPELERFVTVYARTGDVAQERWNITQLFGFALGLAYVATLSPAFTESLSHPPFIPSSSTPYVQPSHSPSGPTYQS